MTNTDSTPSSAKNWLELIDKLETKDASPLTELSVGMRDGIYVLRQPLAFAAWSTRKCIDWVKKVAEDKFATTPPDRQVPPEARLFNLILDGVQLCGHHEELRDMFGRLLEATLDSSTAPFAHPSYTDVIKHLLPDEAKILKWFSLLDSPATPTLQVNQYKFNQHGQKITTVRTERFCDVAAQANCLVPSNQDLYIDNLIRLGLLEYIDSSELSNTSIYNQLRDHRRLHPLFLEIAKNGARPEIKHTLLRATSFGRGFMMVCVKNL